jgi:hypothetical protein
MKCERLNCKLAVETCINRQQIATGSRFEQCLDCPQGKKIVEDFKRRGKKKVVEQDIEELKERVKNGKPGELIPVPEKIDLSELVEEKVIETKQEPIDEAKQLHEAEKIKEALGTDLSEYGKSLVIPRDEVVGFYGEQGSTGVWKTHVVEVNFQRRPDLLRWLEEMAIEDMRTVDQELAWLVKEAKEYAEKRRAEA